jgi:predicted acyl esterase
MAVGSILSKDFPEDKLSQPLYKVKVEKDVFVRMRDGIRVAVDIYRPEDPGKFPALMLLRAIRKTLSTFPQ